MLWNINFISLIQSAKETKTLKAKYLGFIAKEANSILSREFYDKTTSDMDNIADSFNGLSLLQEYKGKIVTGEKFSYSDKLREEKTLETINTSIKNVLSKGESLKLVINVLRSEKEKLSKLNLEIIAKGTIVSYLLYYDNEEIIFYENLEDCFGYIHNGIETKKIMSCDYVLRFGAVILNTVRKNKVFNDEISALRFLWWRITSNDTMRRRNLYKTNT